MGRGFGVERGQLSSGTEGTSMNLDKLARTSGLRKTGPASFGDADSSRPRPDGATRQGENLSDVAARAIQEISELVVENPADATLSSLITRFRNALDGYETLINTDPAIAAARLGIEIDEILRDRAAGKAIRAGLSKALPWGRN
jgi:hypothetical protein